MYLSYACGLVSEYLTEDMSDKLHSHLNLLQPTVNAGGFNKRKSCENMESTEAKKAKKESEVASAKKAEKSTKLSAKEKSKLKMSAGSKTITSFFKKN